MAAFFGLVGGYLDLGAIVFKRDVAHASLYYEQGRHFPWAVPLSNLTVLMIPGLLVALAVRVRPGSVSGRAAAWLFATLALWGPLLRAPLYGVATLTLAAGLGRGIGRWFSATGPRVRWLVGLGLVGLILVNAGTAAVLCNREASAEVEKLTRLPAPPRGAPNVLLVVLDTVRADSLSLYGYARDTTPQLARWAKKGVRFDWALAPAPWTFPSHCSFLTGQWPSRLLAHWQPVLDPSSTTLAEFLSSRGYETAGFVANTHFCSYESGMDRGFRHYEDYPLSPRAVLASSMPGRWLVEHTLGLGNYYGVKWVRSQSRDAAGINRAFLDWLPRHPLQERPFFAFLNYLDAHEPFVPPDTADVRFGLRPRSPADYRMLLDYWDRDKRTLSEREITLARDSYENCITALDRQVGDLLDELERRGILRNTVVIITSDHGEEFGEHGVFNHGFSLYAHEVHVPLVILAPGAPEGGVVAEPVTLRDLPATVVDLLRLGTRSPFPGRSLADLWRNDAMRDRAWATPALSEVDIPAVIDPQRGRGPKQRGLTMSLVARGRHYLVDVGGGEELFNLESDPHELRDTRARPDDPVLTLFRTSLLRLLKNEPVRTGPTGGYVLRFRGMLESLVQRRVHPDSNVPPDGVSR
jgi:arylsulfatase A-like enzyme